MSLNLVCPNGTNQLFPRSLIHSSPECPIFINGTILLSCAHVSNLAPLPYIQLVSCQSQALIRSLGLVLSPHSLLGQSQEPLESSTLQPLFLQIHAVGVSFTDFTSAMSLLMWKTKTMPLKRAFKASVLWLQLLSLHPSVATPSFRPI